MTELGKPPGHSCSPPEQEELQRRENNVLHNDDYDESSSPPSPSPEQLRIAGRHCIRTVIRPDRERRRLGLHSDDEAMQGVAAAQLPPFPLPHEDTTSGEEGIIEDDAQPVGNVLVRNSSGSAVADDHNGEDLGPRKKSKANRAPGEWHEEQSDEVDFED